MLSEIAINYQNKKLLDPFVAVMLHEAHIYVKDLDRLEVVCHIDCKNLYVPSGMLEAYKRHPFFGEIEHIVEME